MFAVMLLGAGMVPMPDGRPTPIVLVALPLDILATVLVFVSVAIALPVVPRSAGMTLLTAIPAVGMRIVPLVMVTQLRGDPEHIALAVCAYLVGLALTAVGLVPVVLYPFPQNLGRSGTPVAVLLVLTALSELWIGAGWALMVPGEFPYALAAGGVLTAFFGLCSAIALAVHLGKG